jgi:hypothetical protein
LNGHQIMTDDEYQDHMDELAKKIGSVLVGERIEDGIIACAACMGFALIQLTPPQRMAVRGHTEKMINEILIKAAEAQQ